LIIDTNIYLSRWPTRRLPCDETPRLVAKLKQSGVEAAWTGSLDGLLHNDISAVNARLAKECAEHGEGLLVPFGSINPTLPDWREDLRRCAEEHKMPGIRLHANYHGYKLDDPVVEDLFTLCEEHELIVQLAVEMEDKRTQHKLMRVEPVDTEPLVRLVQDRPNIKVVLLNALRTLRNDALSKLTAAGQVSFEIAMLEGVGGIDRLIQHIDPSRILFGSYFPVFYFDSAVLKFRESELGRVLRDAIQHENTEKLLEKFGDSSVA